MTYQNIPLLITLLAVLMFAGILIKFIIDARKEQKQNRIFDEQLATVLKTDNEGRGPIKKKLIDKNFIPNIVRQAELVDETVSDEKIMSTFLMACGIIVIGLTLVFGNPFIGLFVCGGLVGVVYYLGSKKHNAKLATMEDQIPAFVSILKANIQAGETPSKALSAAIDNTASPLYDELFMTKALIETGSFKSALTALRLKTENNSLRFLCSCIELSADVGTNLEDQIEIIEEMLEGEKELDRKLLGAVNENKPLALASALSIPFLFILLYFAMDIGRDFWFIVPISWPLLLIVIVIYILSLVFSNREIKKVAEFK